MATARPQLVRVRFLEENHSARGDFLPGDEAEVAARRAQIWAEGGVVEIVAGEKPARARRASKPEDGGDQPEGEQPEPGEGEPAGESSEPPAGTEE